MSKVCQHCGEAWEVQSDHSAIFCPACRWVESPCATCGTTMRWERTSERRTYCSRLCQKGVTRSGRGRISAFALAEQPVGTLSYDEAAAVLSEHYGWIVTVGEVWTLVNEGTLSLRRQDGRTWITQESLDRYLGRPVVEAA